jgi:hypothetical protein
MSHKRSTGFIEFRCVSLLVICIALFPPLIELSEIQRTLFVIIYITLQSAKLPRLVLAVFTERQLAVYTDMLEPGSPYLPATQ